MRSKPNHPEADEKTQTPSKRGGANEKIRGRKDPANPRLWLYGRHAVAAALGNPHRHIRRVVATKNAEDWLTSATALDLSVLKNFESEKPGVIDRLLPPGAVHQGLAAEVYDLERSRLKDVCANPKIGEPVVVLDQITDPQNIGAIFRSAAAFGARGIIVQDRRTPPLSGALAKAAAGAVETVPCVKAVNIARSIEALRALGFYVVGLTGDATETIVDIASERPIAIVLGAEGTGLRHLVSQTCDSLARVPISDNVESLNVSNAAAIALYETTRQSLTR